MFYLQHGGYLALEKALKEMTPAAIIDEVKKSNLRGRGGAGFPTGMKWSFVPKDNPKPKYVILQRPTNPKPGTCKDRPLMEMDPHQLIEGYGSSRAAPIGANRGFIYIRGEYRYVLDLVETGDRRSVSARAISAKKIFATSGFDYDLLIHTGAGAYECGEESALMESLEGQRRGYPAYQAAFSLPVVGPLRLPGPSSINVENSQRRPRCHPRRAAKLTPIAALPKKTAATRLLCVSRPTSTSPAFMKFRWAMNMKKVHLRNGRRACPTAKKLKAVIPGGSSCPADDRRRKSILPMDYDSVAKAGSMMGFWRPWW